MMQCSALQHFSDVHQSLRCCGQCVLTVCLCLFLKGAAKALIFPVVQQFTAAFVQALQMPDGPSSDSGLKMEVLKVSSYKRATE